MIIFTVGVGGRSKVRHMTFFHTFLPDPAINLAIDEALLIECEEGRLEGRLRVWESPVFAVILGASSRIEEDVRRNAARSDGIPVFRRSSGGGTVLIGPGSLKLTVVLPTDHDPRLKTVEGAQAYVLDRVADGLRPLCPVSVQGAGDLTVLRGEPSDPGEPIRRKIGGSAQRRLKRAVMVHATVLYDFPLDSIPRYLGEPKRRPAYRGNRSHEEFLANLGLPAPTIVEAVRSVWSAGPNETEVAPETLDLARRLVEERIGRQDWIERF